MEVYKEHYYPILPLFPKPNMPTPRLTNMVTFQLKVRADRESNMANTYKKQVERFDLETWDPINKGV